MHKLSKIAPRVPRSLKMLAIGLLLTTLVVAIGYMSKQPVHQAVEEKGSPAANKSHEAICQLDTQLNAAVALAHTPSEALAAVKHFEPQFDTAVSEAPQDLQPDAETFVRVLRDAIRANDIKANGSSDTFGDAAFQIDKYCDIDRS